MGRVHVEEVWGQYEQSTLSNSYATGDVDADQSEQVGGLVGRNEGNITNSYSLGDVTGQAEVGGLVGYMWREDLAYGPTLSSVTHCYSFGEVEGQSDTGGLIGLRRDVGGSFFPEVTSSYWNVTDNVDVSDGGESLTAGEFDESDNFVGWDFASVWEMGAERPVLRWE